MGLGGYLAGKSEIDHYNSERKREAREVLEVPDREIAEIYEIFEPYGISREEVEPLLTGLQRNNEVWVDFMMKFELNLEKPSNKRTWISALTIGTSYFLGGLIPLIPYTFIEEAYTALLVSAIATLVALFIFGYFKARIMGMRELSLSSALHMMFVGAVAAGVAFGITRAIPQKF